MTIIRLLLQSRIARYIGGVLGATLILAGALVGIRRNAVEGERQRVEIEKMKAEAKGDAAVVESRRSGLPWQERLKRNGGKK